MHNRKLNLGDKGYKRAIQESDSGGEQIKNIKYQGKKFIFPFVSMAA